MIRNVFILSIHNSQIIDILLQICTPISHKQFGITISQFLALSQTWLPNARPKYRPNDVRVGTSDVRLGPNDVRADIDDVSLIFWRQPEASSGFDELYVIEGR